MLGLVLPMDLVQRFQLENDIRRPFDEGDFDGAVTAGLRGYGPEVLELLMAFHRNEDDAAEVFSLFAEQLWRSIQSFTWSSSFRTWTYVIARRTSFHYTKQKRRRASRTIPFPEGSELSGIEEKVRSETLSYLRTARRTRLLQLRDALAPEEQMLLMLRVDRQLPWNDLARVLHEEATELDKEALKREAARLRKSFQTVKDKLYAMAQQEGLVEPGKKGRRKTAP